MNLNYFSEYKQDVFLDQEVFSGKEHGVFVEVGAGDGVKFSNTYFFEQSRNWRGLCIEPRPVEFEKLIGNRTCACEKLCISNSGQPEKFVEFTGNWLPMLSGIERNFYEPHQLKIEEGMGQTQHNHQKIVHEMPSSSLRDLLDKHGLTEVDYCSIDTEGSELEVLESIDFDRVSIRVFTIENNYGNTEINEFMKGKGYELVSEIGVPRVALDQIYVKR